MTYTFTHEELKFFVNSIVTYTIKNSITIDNTHETPNRNFLIYKAINETAKEFKWQQD